MPPKRTPKPADAGETTEGADASPETETEGAAEETTDSSAPALEERPQFEFGLSQPGEDVPDGARRFGCPDCGQKHDVVNTRAVPGQGGTWSVPDFKCLAGCGYSAAVQPVV